MRFKSNKGIIEKDGKTIEFIIIACGTLCEDAEFTRAVNSMMEPIVAALRIFINTNVDCFVPGAYIIVIIDSTSKGSAWFKSAASSHNFPTMYLGFNYLDSLFKESSANSFKTILFRLMNHEFIHHFDKEFIDKYRIPLSTSL